MAQSYHQSQAALAGFLDSMQQDTSMSAYNLFGPSQYPESVAFWHDPSAAPPPMALPAPSYPPKQPTLLQPIPDQKKHRRTRSGCFTCRSRRIKCDETRPICERCRKGSRDCVYPSPTAPSAKSSRSTAKTRSARPQSQGSDSSGRVDVDEVSPLEPIIDEEEPEGADGGSGLSPTSGSGTGQLRHDLHRTQSGQSLRKRSIKQPSEAGSFHLEPSSSPSTESSRFESMSVRSASISQSTLDLLNNSRLSDDIRFYLDFHQQFISHEHFFLRQGSAHFIHHSIIELALGYEPLLYALVGFSAYHHTLQGGGKLYAFLKYYNKALTLLRKSLESGEGHSEATLCTVLVLTTFEEYIGDWVNLIDHHQAAHALMRELLTPESANLIELHTNIFLWYARFDVVAGILAGTEAILGRDWYMAKEHYDAEQAALYPDDPSKQLALVASINRRFGLDMASLYAKLSRGMIPIDQFAIQNEQLGQTMERAKNILKQFDDCEDSVRSYPNQQPLTDNDIVDPYVPGCILQGPLWDGNYARIDLLSTELMFKYQTMLSLKQPLIPDLERLAFEQCQLIETISRWPAKGNGYCIGFKNSIGLSSMFLPKDLKHQMWSRHKLALMEQNGYIIAPRFRAALAAIWQLPDINHWWLPNDEGYTDIIREVREMSEERMNQPLDDFRENVRDMKSLFWKLSVDDQNEEQSPSSSHTSYT
ncbi:Putative Zn(II)2Cys6 transcription factor [Penicillium brasilianum]|uniref:Putative Zn(II)2Cys6 transcription factor n=1 Tax=Penicillium brasilianum TaxID=104259 RepID=A0A0F7TXN9_PENBI|nr:Putative Zn(II)2Cys6 transcription factor [Penicillium brasilianum]